MSLYNELKRRNVFKVTIAYIIVGWLIMQIGEVMAPALHLPDWINSALAFFVILGFPLAIIFAWAFEITTEGLKLQKEVDRDTSITHITGRKLDFWIIGLLGVALVVFAYDKFVLDPGRDAAEIEAAVQVAQEQSAPAPVEGKSIAVLPFVNMSNDPDQEYFSDGISEELLNVLARYPGLRVAARTSSFQFKGQNQDVAEIARLLRVNHVLEGSVRKSGTRLRITAQLIEADKGYHLWSETYDRELTDVFAIQDEISEAIGEALKVKLALDAGSGTTSPTVPEAASPEAFEQYAIGRQLINLRGRQNLEKAVVHLQRSLKLDPNYAPARAQMAIAYMLLGSGGGSYGDTPVDVAEKQATPHLQRALELDANLAEAHGGWALLRLQNAELDETIRHATRALELNPSYVDAINWLFLAYQRVGLYQEANETLLRLLEIDPLSIVGRSNRATRLAVQGQIEAAHTMAASIAEQNPGNSYSTHGQIATDTEGAWAHGLGWFLQLHAISPGDSFANGYGSFIFGTLDMLPEALRMREDRQVWAYYAQQDWPAMIASVHKRLETDPGNVLSIFYMAKALHLSGEIAQAQEIYEDQLAQNSGQVLLDPAFSSPMPTARAAFGRLQAGDAEGAAELVEMARADLRERNRANYRDGFYFRSLAVLEAIEGNYAVALHNLEEAIDAGHREWNMFSEPAYAALADNPDYLALQTRLDELLAIEREKALQMLCFGDPIQLEWEPLPGTCDGIQDSRALTPE